MEWKYGNKYNRNLLWKIIRCITSWNAYISFQLIPNKCKCYKAKANRKDILLSNNYSTIIPGENKKSK